MDEIKYHICEDMIPRKCEAKSENCPYKGTPHFNSKEEAQTYIDNINEEKENLLYYLDGKEYEYYLKKAKVLIDTKSIENLSSLELQSKYEALDLLKNNSECIGGNYKEYIDKSKINDFEQFIGAYCYANFLNNYVEKVLSGDTNNIDNYRELKYSLDKYDTTVFIDALRRKVNWENTDYHSPEDSLETVKIDFLENVTEKDIRKSLYNISPSIPVDLLNDYGSKKFAISCIINKNKTLFNKGKKHNIMSFCYLKTNIEFGGKIWNAVFTYLKDSRNSLNIYFY